MQRLVYSSLASKPTGVDPGHQKAEAAANKAAAENAKKAVLEDQEWSKGAKSNAKK